MHNADTTPTSAICTRNHGQHLSSSMACFVPLPKQVHRTRKLEDSLPGGGRMPGGGMPGGGPPGGNPGLGGGMPGGGMPGGRIWGGAWT
eukprot:1158479-Pelagomonas_calceolata.AAC.4